MEAGRELDALIAKEVFGIEKPLPGDAGILIPWEAQLKHYSTRIQDAWLVVEKLNQDNACNLRWYNPEGMTSVFSVAFGFGKKVGAEGETMPHAICLAALKAAQDE